MITSCHHDPWWCMRWLRWWSWHRSKFCPIFLPSIWCFFHNIGCISPLCTHSISIGKGFLLSGKNGIASSATWWSSRCSTSPRFKVARASGKRPERLDSLWNTPITENTQSGTQSSCSNSPQGEFVKGAPPTEKPRVFLPHNLLFLFRCWTTWDVPFVLVSWSGRCW